MVQDIHERERFLAPFMAAGFEPVEPPVLQPSSLFLDLSGEEIAKRLYITTDNEGTELCLRPELTIPVCRAYLMQTQRPLTAAYCYYGMAFRQHGKAVGEFLQAGVESIGREDTAQADADVFALALSCAKDHGVTQPLLRIGDTSLFRALIAALDLPSAWERRLLRDFGRNDLFAADLATLDAGRTQASSRAGVLAALAGADRKAARALVEDLLAIGSISQVGGRSVGEIADRFLEQADLAVAGERVSEEKLALLRRYLAISGAPSEAALMLRTLASEAGLPIAQPLRVFEARNAALVERGIDLNTVRFDAAFGRRLDYYSGFVFEFHQSCSPDQPQFIGGGRYDGLLHLLGAQEPVPAVGFSVWIERLPVEMGA